jgi:glycosyltransferase involved in cell wall biosynthesis
MDTTTRSVRIGIDGRPLIGRRSGVGRYVFELCRQLDLILPAADFFVYSNVDVELPVVSDRWHLRLDRAPFMSHLKPAIWLKLRCGSLCAADRIDAFWGGLSLLPRLDTRVRSVSTVYDLTWRIAPQSMGRLHRLSFSIFFGGDLRRATHVAAISHGTADRLLTLYGRPADAIVTPAVDQTLFQSNDRAEGGSGTGTDIKSPYLLAVATWEPRKNLELLVRTWMKMRGERLMADWNLVLVGGRGWKDGRLSALVMPGKNNGVIATGYVDDQQLAALYRRAELFVFPSCYEGFGLPVREALACGTRVVASDIPEIREAGGGDCVYVQPTESGLREGILQALKQARPDGKAVQSWPTWHDGAMTMARLLSE